MKQQNNAQATGKRKQITALILSWLIILGTYLLLRIIFLVIGLHLYASVLGGCLAIIPYALAAIYLCRSLASPKTGLYMLGFMFPAIVEKIMLYLLAAFLYGINPVNIAEVTEKVALDEPFVNFLTTPSARYVLGFSFFNVCVFKV